MMGVESVKTRVSKQSFVVVSNRLPVSVKKVDGKLKYERSNGGLATAMESLGSEHPDMLWIGWPGIASDELTDRDKADITTHLQGLGCMPVFLTSEQVDKFYNGYANDTIWPLFHYFHSLATFDADFWEAYKQVNQVYEDVVAKHATSSALIWVHDYHLMLLPKLLRKDLPHANIGFFLHIPFPSYEIFRLLPNRSEILTGLLGADLVGFHTYDYARHFLSSVLRILGSETTHGTVVVGERTILTDAFPIGIDYEKFTLALDDPETKQEIERVKSHYKNQKIVLSVDRLDYSKGIINRLRAFEQFLRDNPQHRQKVTLMVVAVPSRTEIDAYKDLRVELETAIAHVNGEYGTVDWVPVTYQFKNLPFSQIVALYACSDIALVTPIRDGMNLVAKEYVACRRDKNGVLILSEMTGAVDELPEALSINPNDKNSIASALNRALDMKQSEQTDRMQSMQRRLSQYTVKRWASDFVEQLQRTKREQARVGRKLLSKHDEEKLLERATKAKRRLLMLDYDGTLREFVKSPNPKQAAPSQELLSLLARLSTRKDTQLCIISGRTKATLEGWFGHLPIALAAEHGAWMKYGSEWSQHQAVRQQYKKLVVPVMEYYTERTPGSRVEEKDFAVVWHYRNTPTELAAARSSSLMFELRQVLAGTDIGVYGGSKIVEVKPTAIHKGTIAEDLLAMHDSDFVLCAGDDYTDEDMFNAVPDDAVTLKVGLGSTNAMYQIATVDDLINILQKLSNH